MLQHSTATYRYSYWSSLYRSE